MKINTQSIALLATVVTIVSNLLSINSEMSELKILTFIKSICYFILPILLIKPILLMTFNYRYIISSGFLLVSIVFWGLKQKRKKTINIADDDKTLIISILLSNVFFWINLFYPQIIGYETELSIFIQGLSVRMPYFDVLSYLCNNLKITLFLFSDIVTMVLLFVVEIKELFFYSYLIHKEMSFSFDDVNVNYRKFASNVMITLALSGGLQKIFINYVCSEIIF